MRRELDCLIVGSGIGSLTCGTVLAQRGWRVLLLTNGPLEDSFYWIRDGVEHERSPGLLWGFEERGFLHPLVAPEEEPPMARLHPGIQVVLPRHRVGLYGLGPDWERELRREFSSSWPAMLRCSERLCHLSEVMWRRMGAPLRNITPWGHGRLVGRRHLRTFLRQRGIALPFCDLAEAVAAACFNVKPSQTTVAMAATAFGHARKGFFVPRGGTKAFIEQLICRFQALGGKIQGGAVGEIKSRWATVREVATSDGGVVSCRYLVLEPNPGPGNRIVHLLVDEALIPGEMGRNVLLVETDQTEGAPPALLHLALGVAHDTLPQKRAVAIRILQASRRDPVSLLEEAFPGWVGAQICAVPSRQDRLDFPLASRWLRPRNLAVISAESPLGHGLSAAAWNGRRIATRLLSRG